MRGRFSLLSGTAAVLMLVLPGMVRADFINSSFETGDFAGWSVGGVNGGCGVATAGTLVGGTDPYCGSMYVTSRTGDYAAYAITAGTLGEYFTISQSLDLPTGYWKLGFYVAADGPSVSGFGLSTGIDVNGAASYPITWIGDHHNYGPFDGYGEISADGGWVQVSTTYASSGGPANIVFFLSGSGTARALFSIDDPFIESTSIPPSIPPSSPEPATLSLLALGGLLVLRRRRNK